MTRATPADRSFSPPTDVIHLVPHRDSWTPLQRYLAPFVGREREIATLQSLLCCPDVSLLTLTGVNWGAALSRYGYATVTQARGDVPRALALYRESLHYWRQIGDEGSVAVCLEGIASALCAAGVSVQAARLLGAAQALREAIDFPVPCNALASYGGLVRSVRDCLGETAFAEPWLAGLRLSADEAIAEASRSLSALVHADRHALGTDVLPRPSLTRREQEVLKLVATGHADREIAEALFISRRTASEHVGHILQKLGARSRTDAAALAVRIGLAYPRLPSRAEKPRRKTRKIPGIPASHDPLYSPHAADLPSGLVGGGGYRPGMVRFARE